MNYSLSQHAVDTIKQRGIRLEWISATLENPQQIRPDREDSTLMHALREIPEYGNRVLRVIYNPTKEPSVLVTVFFDRAMKGKL